MKTESGIHTFSLTAKSSYTEIQNIAGQIPCISKPDKYHLNITRSVVQFKKIGVEIHLYQSLVRPSWIKLIVNPSSLLAGEYCPTELFHEPEKIPAVKKQLRRILDQCGICQRLKAFHLSRCDLTRNLYCSGEQDLECRLDLYRKSYVMPRYTVDSGDHFWSICCKSSTFSVYDKTCELNERHGISIDSHILRLELRMERKRVVRTAKSTSWEGQLAELCGKADSQLDHVLHRLYQDCGDAAVLDAALDIIKGSPFRAKTRKQLSRLVTLAAKSESLQDVRRTMKLNRTKFKRLLDRFYILGINPIPQGSAQNAGIEPWFLLKKRKF